MNAIMALFGLLGQTIARQEAIISALEKKGVLKFDEMVAELPSKGQAQACDQFVELMKQFEKDDK